MSSAKNHRIRSHRSYRNKVSTAENFQHKQYVKAVSKQVMKGKSNFFTRLMGMLKKGDK
jgi:hypothetical protein